jgi:hypothetical protein
MDGFRFDRFARIVALRVSRRSVAKLVPGTMIATFATAQNATAQGDCQEGEISCRGVCADPLTHDEVLAGLQDLIDA